MEPDPDAGASVHGPTDAEWTQALRARLTAPGAAREVLVDVVRWLDRSLLAWHENLDWSDETDTGLRQRVFVRIFAVVTAELVDTMRSSAQPAPALVVRTLEAARRYVECPGSEQLEELYERATASYPHGPGDGCYALEGPPCPGIPGSGCGSGAGSLVFMAERIGFERTLERLRTEVVPHLEAGLA